MGENYDFWRVLAGVAIFMLGMQFLEDALQAVAGRKFKLYLRKHTSGRLKGITSGALVTLILQSSSVVSLLALAFVGAGILTMQNSLAVILGANLGTTFSNWIIATVGFSGSIENIAFPIIAIAGIAMILTRRWPAFNAWSRFFLGLGFLFAGLSFIKEGVEAYIKDVDVSVINDMHVVVHVLAGFAITSLIQSGSATIAILLSLLYANAVSLPTAMAITLGSEMGTATKIWIASFGGSADKKRVALGTLGFRLVTTIVLIGLIPVMHTLIFELMGIRNPLIALVCFQTIINLSAILIFLPILPKAGSLLESFFTQTTSESRFIHKVDMEDIPLALSSLEKESRYFIFHVMQYGLNCFDIKENLVDPSELHEDFPAMQLEDQYQFIKTIHGHIHGYYIRLVPNKLNTDETAYLERLVSCNRNAMYAAKSLHDSEKDILQLRNSSKNIKYDLYRETQTKILDFFKRIIPLLGNEPETTEIFDLYQWVTEDYNDSLKELYQETTASGVDVVEITTLINFNRELISVFKSLVFSVKEIILEEDDNARFDALPGFIR